MTSLNERLWNAAKEGKIDEIAALLDQGADIDFAPPSYRATPLMRAIHGKHEATSLYLIDRGANVGLQSALLHSGLLSGSALHFACGMGMERVVRELLKRGAPVEEQNSEFKRPLHYAAEYGHESIVRLLVVEHGAQVDSRDGFGMTPLLWALRHGNEGVATFLASSGASWHAVDVNGRTALHCACEGGLMDVATRLLDEFRFNLHAKTTRGESCLHLAAGGGSVETCRLLIERGIPVDALDHLGQTPLFDAWFREKPKALFFLLDAGADMTLKDKREWSVLAHASDAGRPHSQIMVPELIERGARLDGPVPRDSYHRSFDEGAAWVLSDGFPWVSDRGFLATLFNKPEKPIPVYRKALRWALTSPAVAAAVEKNGWSLVGAAKTEEEAEEMIKKRLSLVRDDAWERRKHLVIDRALDWGYGDSGK